MPDIIVRDLRFGRARQPARWWLNGDPIATAWFNALSGTFPRGEAYFIESIRAFRDGTPPELREQIRQFIVQEVNHSREHVAFNRTATDAGYDMARIDRGVQDMLKPIQRRAPILNLASTMALEHFTAMMAHEFLANPRHFIGADPHVGALWRWHAIEEIEHKAVAHDTWRHATRTWSRARRWRVKSLMMVLVTQRFIGRRFRDTLDLLAQDGLIGPRVKLRLLAYLVWNPGVLRRIVPMWVSYFGPGFHPWQIDDRALIDDAERQLIAAGYAAA